MLPSPEMLKYKILVKNKKRKEDMPDQMEKDEEIVKKEEEVAPALSGTGQSWFKMTSLEGVCDVT